MDQTFSHKHTFLCILHDVTFEEILHKGVYSKKVLGGQFPMCQVSTFRTYMDIGFTIYTV